jgi:hypothetical protein
MGICIFSPTRMLRVVFSNETSMQLQLHFQQLKVLQEMDSSKAGKHLAAHPELLAESLRIFREEMKDLGNSRPLILAFGHRAYDLARKHL